MRADWPGAALVRDELDQVPRRAAFKREHPGTEWSRIGQVYIGHVPYADEDGGERSITMRGDSWAALLDALETYFRAEADTG